MNRLLRTTRTGQAAKLLALATLAACANPSHAELTAQEARAAMKKASTYMRSISTNGGYLWKYSPDLRTRAGEFIATDTQAWAQRGTVSVGSAFLDAYTATDDKFYLDAALDAADALAKGQLRSGGWDKALEFDSTKRRQYDFREGGGGKKGLTVLDDNLTQGALTFLIQVAKTPGAESDPRFGKIRSALDYGLEKLVEAQYPNGAWPQRYNGQRASESEYPVRKARFPDGDQPFRGENYHKYYTLNDNIQRNTIQLMLAAYRWSGNKTFLDSAKRGGDFLILAQLPDPQPVWAQQYNVNMEPDWARKFEPAAATASESAGVIRTLVELYAVTGEDKYLAPIPKALAWFEKNKLDNGKWARFYELRTNRPIYGSPDARVLYNKSDVDPAFFNSYGFEGTFRVEEAMKAYDDAKKLGAVVLLKRIKDQENPPKFKKSQLNKLRKEAEEAVNDLDSQGRWITRTTKKERSEDLNERIDTDVFVKNVKAIANFIRASGSAE